MSPRRDHAAAEDAVRHVLDRLGLPTYLFAVRLEGDRWTVVIELPRDGAWREVRLRAPRVELLAALGDPSVQRRLAARWAPALGASVAA